MSSSAQTFDVRLAGQQAKPISLTMVSSLLRLFDVMVVVTAGYLAYVAYTLGRNASFDGHYLGPILTGALIASAAFHLTGIYDEKNLLANIRRLDRLFLAWIATIGILLTIAFISKITDHYSRIWTVSWFFSTIAILGIGRLFIGLKMQRLAAEGRFARQAIIVGAGEHGQRLAGHLNSHGAPYLNVLGFFDDRADRVPDEIAGHRVLGDISYLMKFVESHHVDVILIALPWSAEKRLLQIIEQLATKPVQLRLAPDLIGFNFLDRGTTNDARLPMLHLFDRPISGWSHALKTIEDWTLALLVLLFLGPLMGLIALAIKLDSPGPVLFQQKRHGFNNKSIDVLKFRSMHVNSGNQDGSVQATKNDSRITRVGRFLRKSSLDELPQVLNVLRGDMSIVGPRPHPMALKTEGRYFEEVVEKYAARHRVKPGITGWAQVNGWRGETDTVEKIQQRVEHDLYYVDNWSVWLDLYIILKTLLVVWNDENAY